MYRASRFNVLKSSDLFFRAAGEPGCLRRLCTTLVRPMSAMH